jgi:hypothetical protein
MLYFGNEEQHATKKNLGLDVLGPTILPVLQWRRNTSN